MTESTRYPQIIRYLSETPWAILPSALVKIRELIAFKAAGGVLTREEIEERIGAANGRLATQSKGAIAVIPIAGVIVPHADMFTDISGGTSIDGLLERFRAAMADDSISTIVFDIDSPGGSVELLAEAAAEFRAARDVKDIVAVANTMAASAAYYLMAQATECVCTPSGMVGSIGTIAEHMSFAKALEMEGLDATLITFGDNKENGHPFVPLSDEAREEIQELVDSYGNEFVADVAKGRGISVSTVENTFGQGRLLRADEALSVGMIDRIASLDETIARLLGGRKASRRSAKAELAEATVSVTDEALVELAADSAAGRSNTLVAAGAPAFSAGLADASWRLAAHTTVVPAGGGTDHTRKEAEMDANTTDAPRTREEIVARMEAIAGRLSELDREYTGQLMEGDDEAEFDALDAEHDLLTKTLKQIDTRMRSIERKASTGNAVSGDGAAEPGAPFRTNADTRKNLPENVFDLPAYRAHARSLDDLEGLWKEGARRVVEGLAFECDDEDKVKAHIEKLVKREVSNGQPSESFAHRILITGSQEYDRAFGKMLMGRQLTSKEDNLIRAAVSHTGLGSETPVPVTIDPSVMLTSDGQANPLRAISDVRTITGKTWRGINSEGIVVEYAAELTAVDPVTPVFDAPEADVVKAQAEIQMSIEIDQDWPSLRSELAIMLADAKDAKEAEKFLLGEGVNEPEGLIFALVDDGTSVEETETLNTFTIDDLFAFKGTLPARFKSRASYLANDAIYDAVRVFGVDEVGPNAFWTDMSEGSPARLLGKPAYEASNMEGDVTAGGEPILVYGDFSRGFLIIDRVGMNVLNAGLVRNADGKLTGAVAIYAYWRNTSKLRSVNAFRLLAVQNS